MLHSHDESDWVVSILSNYGLVPRAVVVVLFNATVMLLPITLAIGLLRHQLFDLDELLRALREVVAGRSVIDAWVVELLVAHRARLAESPVSMLSPRELDVLQAMAQGQTNRAIAERLVLSESAVEKHVNAIFSKLGISNEPQFHRRVAAVLTFLRDVGS